jgi:flagellar basal body P-ring formation protein FlgA
MTFPNFTDENESLKNLLRILLLLFMTAPLFGAEAVICTKDWIATDDKEIILGEIAEVYGVDQLLVAKLNSFYLDAAPAEGKSLRLTHADIKRHLENAGFDTGLIQFSGAYETIITRASKQELNDNPVAKVVIDFLHSHFAQTGEEFDIHFRNVPEVKKVIAGAALQILTTPNQSFRGNIVVIVGEKSGDKIAKRYPVSVNVQTYGKVLIANSAIEMNQPLKSEDFSRRRQETTFLREIPVTEFAEITNMQAARNIVRNSILTRDKIQPVPAVKQGDPVTITIKTVGVKITALGRARKSGGIGETIPVVNLSSLKQIDAVVVDSTTVAINF